MADNGLPSFIRQEKESLIFNGKDQEMLAYIPEKFFERNIAEVEGNVVNLLGIFPYTVQDTKTGKNIGLKNFRYPTPIYTEPYRIDKVKQITLTKNSMPEDFRIFRYKDGDAVVSNIQTVQFVGNVEKVINMFYILGYIPNTIKYTDLVDYIFETMHINGNDCELNAQIVGITISEVCRGINDISKPYRLTNTTDETAYRSISIKEVSKFTSAYTALISEDFDESLMYALMNNDPKETPLERVLVGEDNT